MFAAQALDRLQQLRPVPGQIRAGGRRLRRLLWQPERGVALVRIAHLSPTSSATTRPPLDHLSATSTSRPPLAPPLAHLSPTSALQVRLTARRSAVRSPLRGPRAGAGGTSATISAISRLCVGCICCICDGPEQADVYYHCDQLIKVTVAPPALLAAALRPSSPPRLSPPLRGCTPPSSPSGKPTLRPSGCSSCRRASTLLARCGTPASCGAGCEQRLFTVSACGAGRPASCGAGSG